MNSDSFFDTEFFHEHKGLITTIFTVSLAFLTIFWLYKGLKSENPNNIQVNTTISPNTFKSTKRRLTINAQDLLYSSLNQIDISFMYPILETLSKQFDIYLIILVDENENTNDLLEKFSLLYEDGIIHRHVIFIKLREFFLVLNWREHVQ